MIEFAPLFTLEVEHAYYGGRCPDFEFAIPSRWYVYPLVHLPKQ